MRECGEGNWPSPLPRTQRLASLSWARSRFGLGFVSRFFLGTSDAFSGLFALRRSDWVDILEKMQHRKAVVELGSRNAHEKRARCVDVPVIVDDQFQTRLYGFGDLRQTKHMLDRRFGNYSRLDPVLPRGRIGHGCRSVVLCIVSSGFSLPGWCPRRPMSVSWQLALARVLSIGIALVWNFLLNRRLTFNDALKREHLQAVSDLCVRQRDRDFSQSYRQLVFCRPEYAFFARHRLAAAVVGIIAATGISFSTSRWMVFGRRLS